VEVHAHRRSGGRFRRAAGTIGASFGAAVCATLLSSASAYGHATVVSSNPEPGQRLGSTPGVVVVRFSEPVDASLSQVAVTAPDGRTYRGNARSAAEASVPLPTSLRGVYRVEWTTVSALDGHTLRGAYRFGVQVQSAILDEGATSTAPGPVDLLTALFRLLEYGGLFLAAGGLALGYLSRLEPPVGVRFDVRPAMAAALAGGLGVVVGEVVAARGSLDPPGFAAYLTNGMAGEARFARIAVEAAGLLAGFLVPRMVAPALVLALSCLALTGHAAAVQPPWLGVTADLVHVAAAAVWAGGILALARLRVSRQWSAAAGSVLVARFSPLAIGAFVVTAELGLLRAFQELGSPSDLADSTYGQLLVAKVLIVGAMMVTGLVIWRARRLVLRLDALLAASVIAVTALLAAHPLPPRRAAEADRVAVPASSEAALPAPDDLTLASSVGSTLLALTIRPALPGPNELRVYLAPLDGESAASEMEVTLRLDGRETRLGHCGPACRGATMTLRGGERVAAQLEGREPGVAMFDVPTLPAASGAAVVQRASAGMHALRSFRSEERLGPARIPIVVSYAFEAPDRMRALAESGYQRVAIGPFNYTRDGPDRPWRSSIEERIDATRMTWDGAAVQAARLLGRSDVDGVPVTVLSFYQAIPQEPTWYRLWVDDQMLIRRSEMRAQMHFMDTVYRDFDVPMAIDVPAPG